MNFKDFEEHFDYLIKQVKTFLYANDNNIFDKLDFEADEIYLDPFFFACINNIEKEYLKELIACYSSNSVFSSKTNHTGALYLPGLGTYFFDHPNQVITIHKNGGVLDFTIDGKKISPKKIEEIRRNKYGIEYFSVDTPIIRSQFRDPEIVLLNEKKNEDYFSNALEVIKDTYPEFFDLIVKSVKKVVFYRGRDNSFASIQTHGIIYLNIKEEYNEIFHLDNILHQSAHVIFNTFTLRTKKELFQFPYTAPFSNFTGDRSNGEEVYGRFHGLFTQSNINTCLLECYRREVFSDLKHKELMGRLTSNMTRFAASIKKFDKPHLYKEEGLKWHSFFTGKYDYLSSHTKHLVDKYKVDNQPYVFDFNIFYETNF